MSPELSRETRIKLCALTMMLSSYQVREVLRPSAPIPMSFSSSAFSRSRKEALKEALVTRVTAGSGGDSGRGKMLSVSEGGKMGYSKDGVMSPGAILDLLEGMGYLEVSPALQAREAPVLSWSCVLRPEGCLGVSSAWSFQRCFDSAAPCVFLVSDPEHLPGAEGHRLGLSGGEEASDVGASPQTTLPIRPKGWTRGS
jgi:hypothetical protein